MTSFRSARKTGDEHGGPMYLIAHACFECRASFKRTADGPSKCPHCGREAFPMGRAFKAPLKRSREQWLKVQILYGHGFRFDRYGRHGGAPLPKRLRDVEAFIAKHPTHPLKTAQSNFTLQRTGARGARPGR
jgi:DNA-directed RNA polymerase subunit RPC12/RpoP